MGEGCIHSQAVFVSHIFLRICFCVLLSLASDVMLLVIGFTYVLFVSLCLLESLTFIN